MNFIDIPVQIEDRTQLFSFVYSEDDPKFGQVCTISSEKTYDVVDEDLNTISVGTMPVGDFLFGLDMLKKLLKSVSENTDK